MIDLYLNGEYDVPQVEVISDIDYYFENNEYFNVTITIVNKKG
jgi:hypothetical protein